MSTPDLIQGIFDTAAGLTEDVTSSPESLTGLAERAIDLSDWLWAELNERKVTDLENIACAVDCAWCCYQQVGITKPQVLHIAAHINGGKAALSKAEMLERLRTLDAQTNGLDNKERLALGLPCAFLENNRCLIYEVRPLACRGANSVDADVCRKTVEDPDGLREQWQEDGSPNWIHALPFEGMRAIQLGILAGLKDKGMEEDPLELTSAVRAALEEEID